MSKNKQRKVWRHTDFLVVLGVVAGVFSFLVLRNSQKAFGKDNWSDYGEEKKINFFPKVSPTATPTVVQESQFVQPTIEVTATPTTTPLPTATPTEVVTPVGQPTLSPNSFETQSTQGTQNVQTQIVVVPISQKSVISGPSVSSPKKSNGSIIQNIKESIGSFGKPAPTATPTPIPTAAPLPTTKDKGPNLDKIKLKYQMSSGQVVLSAMDSVGNYVSVEESDLKRVEGVSLGRLEKRGIGLNLTGDNKFAISKDGIIATTELPISINVETKTLMLATSDGDKPLAVLPDRALKNIIDLGVVSGVNTAEVPSIDYTGGQVFYKFGGNKAYKMFGLFKVSAPLSVMVSADTGEVISGDQPWLTKAIRLLSI